MKKRLVNFPFFLLVALISSILSGLCFDATPAQVQAKKEYVPILPAVGPGALPQVKVLPLTFDAQAKTGTIPLEVVPAGFWKSSQALGPGSYDVFEFEVEIPSHTIRVGEPNVPMKVLEVDIPANAEVDSVSLKPELLKTVENITLLPNSEPLPVGQLILEKEKVTINTQVYEQKEAYPGKFYELITVGYSGGRKVVLLKTFPAQFFPALKKVEFYRLTGSLKFKAESVSQAPGQALATKDYQAEIGPERWKEFESTEFYERVKPFRPLTVDYVIIAADLFYCPARDLAAHHTSKGTKTAVVRSKEILARFSGMDPADKIRNFIKCAYARLKIKWVLFFGDVSPEDKCDVAMVPTRMVVDPAPYGGVDDGWIPCDYYYACLDGTWDVNGNGKYGEAADNPDLLPEICVGRLPVNTFDDAQKIVQAIMKYENTPPAAKGALVAANDLGWGGHEVGFKNDNIIPILKSCAFAAVSKQFEKEGTLSVSTFANAVNAGLDFIQYYGHGSPTSTQLMSAAQVKSLLSSTESYPVVFSLSCSTSRYDGNESFGEAWIECTKASAYIGSTRVAYGSLSTGEGLDIRFIQNFCKLQRTGCALDNAKYNLFKDYGWDPITLKTILEFTLFGDPVMKHVK